MEYLIFIIIAPLSVGILVTTGIALLRREKTRVSQSLLVFFCFVTGYLCSNTAELILSSEDAILTAAKIGHLFFSFLPVIWLRFTAQHTGNRFLNKPFIWLLFVIIPSLTVLFLFYPGLTRFIWQAVDFQLIHGFVTMDATYGPWLYIYGGHCYILYILGMILLLHFSIGGKQIYQKQTIFMILGISIPICFNTLYVFRLIPFLRKDFTSVSFAITAVMCYVGITRLKLLNIYPVARNQIIHDLASGYLVLDNNYRIVDYNEMFGELLGIQEEHIGEYISRTPNYKTLGIEADLFVSHEGKIGFEGKFYRYSAKPIAISANGHEGVLLSVHDTTSEELLIKQKTSLAENLERANRQLKSAQDTIIQQEKLASIGQLTSGLAHEINNPLSFVRSNFRIFRHFWNLYDAHCFTPDNPRGIESDDFLELRKRLEEILKDSEEGTERVIKIIQDLLRFSRTENPENSLYDLNQGIESSLLLMSNKVRYVTSLEKNFGDLPKVECREIEVNQVIMNLISNALFALEHRRKMEKKFVPSLILRTWADEHFVFLEIANNGVPIPKKDLPFLFEPFFTTKKSGEGTGLGLAIAREIIEGRYQGKIQVTSGKTTSFILSLPIVNVMRKIKDDSCSREF